MDEDAPLIFGMSAAWGGRRKTARRREIAAETNGERIRDAATVTKSGDANLPVPSGRA